MTNSRHKSLWKLSKEAQSLLTTLNHYRRYSGEYTDKKETAKTLAEIYKCFYDMAHSPKPKAGGKLRVGDLGFPVGSFFSRINQYTSEMEIELTVKGMRITSKSQKGYWWIECMNFFIEVSAMGNPFTKIRQHLKECTNCHDIFWGGSNSVYCREDACIAAQLRQNVSNWKRSHSK